MISAPGRRVYTVSALTTEVKAVLEDSFPAIWVEGELSNFKHHTSGHMYFTLKDAQAQIRGVMFRGHNRLLRFQPTDGLAVLVCGTVTVYERRGEYQITAEFMEPKGVGALQLAFEQLKAKLEAEGLFRDSRKRPLPLLPRKIGIVTSPTGAVIRDMLTIIGRRFPGLEVLIHPVAVQGAGAARGDRGGAPAAGVPGGPGRPDRGPRRRIAGGPVGLQRRDRGPRDGGESHPRHLRGGARDRRDHRGLRGGSSGPDPVGGGGAGGGPAGRAAAAGGRAHGAGPVGPPARHDGAAKPGGDAGPPSPPPQPRRPTRPASGPPAGSAPAPGGVVGAVPDGAERAAGSRRGDAGVAQPPGDSGARLQHLFRASRAAES